MTREEVLASHMAEDDEGERGGFEKVDDGKKEVTRESLEGLEFSQFWAIVLRDADKILHDVDWNSLRDLSMEEMKERGRLLARQKFGAEAARLYPNAER
jgi:hypothetical protein